ncbi:MAG: hypothetical protein ACREAA_01015 [Candidatus Polarisedimenticolia bacterium]
MERRHAAVLCAAVLVALVVHARAALNPCDDAYIIFRYVENVLAGQGAIYNPGERVFGISCPLYFVWLVAAKAALPSFSLEALASRGNVLFLSAAGMLASLLLRHLGAARWAATLGGVAVILGEPALRPSLGGMESPLYLTLSFGALLAIVHHRDTAAVLLASLATLTRPEGMLLLGVVLVALLLKPERSLQPLAGLAPLVLWGLWAWAAYGNPVPHSIVAKSRPLYPLPAGTALGSLSSQIGHWTIDGVLTLVWSLSGRAGRELSRWIYVWPGAVVTLWGLWQWWRWRGDDDRLRRLALPAYLVLLVVFYAVTNPLLQAWYTPLTYAPWVALMLGASLTRRPDDPVHGRLVRAGAASLLVSTLAASFVYYMVPSEQGLILHGAHSGRQVAQMRAYELAARWIGEHSQATDTVAAAEIGIVGRVLPRRILDACGLVSPQALPWIPAPPGERGAQLGSIPTGLIREERPEFVMMLPAFAERSLLVDPWFLGAYELVHEEPFLTGDPRYRAVLVYRRRT